jgi:murein DD-endopeptidase MepM/ murein hydrolase activator NlpD
MTLGGSALAAAPKSEPGEILYSTTVGVGDTIEKIIGTTGASPVEAALVARAIRSKFDPRSLKPGQQITFRLGTIAPNGTPSISAFSVALAKNRYVEVMRDEAGKFVARQTSQPLESNTAIASVLPVARTDEAPLVRADAKPTEHAQSTQPTAMPIASGKTPANTGLTLKIKRGDTMASLLRKQGFVPEDAHNASEALKPGVDLRDLKVDQEVIAVPGPRGANGLRLERLTVKPVSGSPVEVVRDEAGNYAQLNPTEPGEQGAALGAPKPKLRAATKTKTPDSSKHEESIVLTKGATLHSLMKARGYQAMDIVAVAKATALAVEPSMLRWDQTIRLTFFALPGGAKQLETLAIDDSGGNKLVITRLDDGTFASGGARKNASPAVSATVTDEVESDDVAQQDADEPDPPNHGVGVYIEEQAAPRDAAFRLVVAPGDSVMNLLLRQGFDANEIDRAVRALRKIYNPRRLREGQVVTVLTEAGSDGADRLAAFTIPVSERRFVEVQRSGADRFKAIFLREASYADRLPPLDAAQATADTYEQTRPNTPAYRDGESPGDLVKTTPEDSDGDGTGGWSVLSWLGSIGDALGRTGEAAAAAIDLSPTPRPNRALDFEERPTPAQLSDHSSEIEISKGETLIAALARGGANPQEAEAVVAAFKKVHSPRRLRVGQTIALAFDAMTVATPAKAAARAGTTRPGLSRVSLSVGPDRDIVVERLRNDRFSAREVERPLVRSVYKAAGEITSSFYDSALAAGLSIDILSQLVQMFSYDVDFQRSLQPGDTFEVLYERTENDRGEVVEQGNVLFAALTVNKERLELFRYEPPDGPADYYDESGKSVRKALLRTPVDGARISSKFGMRKHPILGFTKKHKGVDFAAPPNTPVFAAGDGVIEKIGWFSSYGRYVRIKHNDSYKTAYAHLKGYARGMKAGSKVRQGQVIGYVGSSGRSTGPHLHYEVIKNDVQVNPDSTKLATGKTLTGKQLAYFQAEMRSYYQMFAQAEAITRVARDNTAANGD